MTGKTFLPLTACMLLIICSCASNPDYKETPQDIYDAGFSLLQKEEYQEASISFTRALEAVEKGTILEGDILLGLGQCEAVSGTFEGADRLYDQALEIYSSLDHQEGIADVMVRKGIVYYGRGKYEEAHEVYNRALDYYKEAGKKEKTGSVLTNVGYIYLRRGAIDEARSIFEEALELYRDLGMRGQECQLIYQLGYVIEHKGEYEQAMAYYREALGLAEELQANPEFQGSVGTTIIMCRFGIGYIHYRRGETDKALEEYSIIIPMLEASGQKELLASVLKETGSIYSVHGEYDMAISQFQKAVDITKAIGNKLGEAICTNSIGDVYNSWGLFEKAAGYYEQGLEIGRAAGMDFVIARSLLQLGIINRHREDYQKALEFLTEALGFYETFGAKDRIATTLMYLGSVYIQTGDYVQAKDYLQRSIDIAGEIDLHFVIAGSSLFMGTKKTVEKDYPRALEIFSEVEELYRESGDKKSLGTTFLKSGAAYTAAGEYDKALEMLDQAVALKDEIRLTADAAARREFFETYIAACELKTWIYIQKGDPLKARESLEVSLNRVLLEHMTGVDTGSGEGNFSGYEIPAHYGVVHLGGSGGPAGIRIVSTDEGVYGDEVLIEDFAREIFHLGGDTMTAWNTRFRGRKVVTLDDDDPFTRSGDEDFSRVVEYYRYLLSKPELSPFEENERQTIARTLYSALLEPVEDLIGDKKKLVIIPQGRLAYLPFETLIMPDGRYLIEKYVVEYSPSLRVAQKLRGIKYEHNRKHLLGFGGALYEGGEAGEETVGSQIHLGYVYNKAMTALENNSSLAEVFKILGYGGFSRLPYSKQEVEAALNSTGTGDVYIRGDVSEARIKKMSQGGSLADYKIIHFAVHGIVVPEIPELSALVLSPNADGTGDDGYLTMGEISSLELKADLVNLAACGSGLGRIYRGEGIVGLPRAFMTAGAKSVMMTLWNIADKSTRDFMVELYGLAAQGGGYGEVLCEVKRRFIASEQYSSPFYWAPYVYYGGGE